MSQLNFIFGLGIFLFGMSQLEFGIRKLSDVRLRHWLKSSTSSRLSSISTGIVTTALLQSSSMVSLLVLAFASAGLIPLINAVGIILGANLGTTFTGWIVAIFGFKLNLEAMAIPLFGVSAFTMAISKHGTRLYYSAMVAFGIALLLFGLGTMKTSMESLPEQWDVSILQGHHPVIYLLFGVVITFLVQSSSAVMMMALAAVNAEFIALPEAVALIIGADLGTTSTTVLGSLSGSSIKRQLAFAHCVFNFIVDITAFLILLPLLPVMLALVSLEDPLYALVAFHSLMNVLGLLAFMPFLPQFTLWIERVFSRGMLLPDHLLERVSPNVIDAALVALKTTVDNIILQSVCNSLRLFSIDPDKLRTLEDADENIRDMIDQQNFHQGYEALKKQEGIILSYSLKMQAQALDADEALELDKLQNITRRVVFSNKSLKDISHNLEEMNLSSRSSMRELYQNHKKFQKEICERLIDLLLDEHPTAFILEELDEIYDLNNEHFVAADKLVHSHAASDTTDGTTVSIQLNANREIRHALKSLIKAVRISTGTESRQGPEAVPAAAETL